MASKTILIIAGDPSGDLHGAGLISALKRAAPSFHIAAVGGPRMKAVADEFIEDLAARGVTGFWEPALKTGFLLGLGLRLKRYLYDKSPHALVCIDYYGFNHLILGIAKKAKVPAYYYVSPQVWASRPGRVQKLKSLVQKMLVIFPFEEKIYREAGVACRFVGHPLLDLLPEPRQATQPRADLRVGILPGSRSSEVRRHLPILLDAFALIRKQMPTATAQIFASTSLNDDDYSIGGRNAVTLVRESNYVQRAQLDLALSCSGTATLENALLGLPMVVLYKVSWPTYMIARALIKVPFIAMANLLAGRQLVPELIQGEATAKNIAHEALKLIENPGRYAILRQDLIALRKSLGDKGAAARAAAEILGVSRG